MGVPKCLNVKISWWQAATIGYFTQLKVIAKGIGIFPAKLYRRAVFEKKMARQDWKMAPLLAPKYENERTQQRISTE